MLLYTSLFNTHHYKGHIKGKVEQSREGIASFSHQCLLVFFHRCLTDRKSALVSMRLLNILENFNPARVCMVLILRLISSFTSILSKTVPCAKTTSSWSTAFSGCPRGVMVKAMDCGIVVSLFVLQVRYYIHFQANTLGKSMNPLILPAMG